MQQVQVPGTRVSIVRSALGGYARCDADAFTESMTDDVLVSPTAFITGRTEYRGSQEARECVEHAAAVLDEHAERLRLRCQRTYMDGRDPSKVLSLCTLTIVRSDGDSFGSDAAYLWTLDGDRIARLEAWTDHAEGLMQLAEPVRIDESRLAGAVAKRRPGCD